MTRSIRLSLFLSPILIIVIFLPAVARPAPAELLIAYGGHNETMAPLWVGVDRGLFTKHGVDPRVLQTRSGPIMMATLASGGAPLVWAAPTSAISAALTRPWCLIVLRTWPGEPAHVRSRMPGR